MATLGVDFKITYAGKESRNFVDSFYKGIHVEGINLRPLVSIVNIQNEPPTKHRYDVRNTNALVFISDTYDGQNPFDLTLISSEKDEDDIPIEMKLKAVGLLILDTISIDEVIVESTVDEAAYRIIV
jgi:hypothetical protein